MIGGVPSEAGSSRPAAAGEVVSPELALVDPEAARRARLALPEIVPTESRIGLRRAVGTVPRLALAFVEEPPSPRRRRGVALAGLVVGAAAVVLVAPLVLDERNSSSPPITLGASAEGLSPIATVRPQGGLTTSSGVPEARTKASTGRARTAGSATVLGTVVTIRPRGVASAKSRRQPRVRSTPSQPNRNFGWVPVKHTFGYRVEFRSGPKLVLRVRARAARLRVPRAQLRPGRYRWLVWRLNRRGTPIGPSVVDAALTIR